MNSKKIFLFCLLLQLPFGAKAANQSVAVYIQHGNTSEKTLPDSEIHDLCETMKQNFEGTRFGGLNSCRAGAETEISKLTTSQDKLLLTVKALDTGNFRLNILSLNQNEDFENLEWTLADKEALEKTVKRFTQFDSHNLDFKRWVLKNVARESTNDLAYNKSTGKFFDRNTLQEYSTQEAVQVFKKNGPKNKHFLRAITEIAILTGVQATTYYLAPAAQDFDYDWNVAGKAILKAEKWRMDDNSWFLNQIGHPITGHWSYLTARDNGYGILESFLMAFATSSVWEILIEYREKISINDLIVTPLAGAVMGEVLLQFQDTFLKGQDSKVKKILGGIFNTPQLLGKLLYGRQSSTPKDLSPSGFKPNFPSQLNFVTSLESTTQAQVGLEGEILKVEDYGSPGKFSEVVSQVPLSTLLLSAGLDNKLQAEYLWHFKTSIRAWRKKSIEKTPAGVQGYELLIAPSNSFKMEMLNSTNGGGVKDVFSTVSLVGGTIDFSFFFGKSVIRTVIDVFGNFSAVRSIAFSDLKQTGDVSGTSSILQNQGYYFGVGPSVNVNTTIRRERFDAGFQYYQANVWSIDGLARWQEEITKDFKLNDQRRTLNMSIGFRPILSRNIHLSAGVKRRSWDSQIPQLDTGNKGRTNQYYLKLKFGF